MVVKVTHAETMVKSLRTQKKKKREKKRNTRDQILAILCKVLFAWEDGEEKLPMVWMEVVQIYYRR